MQYRLPVCLQPLQGGLQLLRSGFQFRKQFLNSLNDPALDGEGWEGNWLIEYIAIPYCRIASTSLNLVQRPEKLLC
ncbi:hypothetical protein GCM10023189_13380 [Nibrella saemangeumensis]|uniref:Uncharacterized protein n=1 Tax=Nibrella saemangeumensis TaxID=1084526 RepID=A0ABP8MIX8_9BACT